MSILSNIGVRASLADPNFAASAMMTAVATAALTPAIGAAQDTKMGSIPKAARTTHARDGLQAFVAAAGVVTTMVGMARSHGNVADGAMYLGIGAGLLAGDALYSAGRVGFSGFGGK